MSTDWSFLEPWREVLCRHLTQQESFSSRALTRLSYCRHDGNPRSLVQCMLVVNFPASDPRQDRAVLQKAREAIELFNVVVAVDKAVFVEMLPDHTELIREIWDSLDTRSIQLIWDCTLVGQLAPSDLVSSKTPVTWGELLGCPDDPWQYSEDFQQAMHRLEIMGLEGIGDQWNVLESIEYCAKHDGVPITADQMIQSVSTDQVQGFYQFSSGLGNLFSYRAALSAQLCAVQDGSELMAQWSGLSCNERSIKGDDVKVYWPTFSLPVEYITVSLACSALKSLTMTFDGSGISDWETAKANAGIFFGTMIAGRRICRPIGGDVTFPALESPPTYSKLNLTFGPSSEMMLAGTCSAILDLSTVDDLKISMAGCDASQWQWIVYALFTNVSNCSVQKLSLADMNLQESDVADIEAVMKSCFPHPATATPTALYGYVDLVEGIELRSKQGDASVVVCQPYRCRALFGPVPMEKYAHVVVPGYGICQVCLCDGLNEFAPDSPSRELSSNERILSMELDLKDLGDGELVAKVLTSIGRQLRHLTVRYTGNTHQRVDLSDIAAACPHLECLFLNDFNVSISTGNEPIRSWGIRRLIIQGSNEILGLPECIGDQKYRMARELMELRVLAPEDRYLSAWLRDLKVSPEFAASLQEHDGDYLSVARETLSVPCKRALISVTAARNLDQHVLSSIFEFAAVPVLEYGSSRRQSRGCEGAFVEG